MNFLVKILFIMIINSLMFSNCVSFSLDLNDFEEEPSGNWVVRVNGTWNSWGSGITLNDDDDDNIYTISDCSFSNGGYEFVYPEKKEPEQEVRIIEREVVREIIKENVRTIQRKTPTVVVLDNPNVILLNPVFNGMNWKVRITTKGSPNYTCAGLTLSESTVGGNGFCSNETFHYKVYWN